MQQLGVLPQWNPMNRSSKLAPIRLSAGVTRSRGTVLLTSSSVAGALLASWQMYSLNAP